MELVKNQAQVFITHIPYRGTGPAVTDLLGGQIDLMFLPIHVALQHVKAGSLRALAISSDKPHPLLPDVPPLRELQLGNLDVDMWYGVLAPKGTPRPLVERLNAELKIILALPEVKNAFETQGMTPAHSSPQEFGTLIERDAAALGASDQGPAHHGRLMWAPSSPLAPPMTSRLDIAIVGAGLGGLAAAATLLQRGHRVRVAEQSPVLGEVGAGIQMSANAVKVLDHLGLRATLEPLAVRPKAFEFRRFDNGELLHRLPLGEQHEQTPRRAVLPAAPARSARRAARGGVRARCAGAGARRTRHRAATSATMA